MGDNYLSKRFYFMFTILLLVLSLIEGKGFGRGRVGGSYRKGSGTYRGSSSYSRPNYYGNNWNKPRKGSSFGGKAASFAAGAAGGIAAYSLMRSMAGSYHSRPYGRYGPGYGLGETCTNNEDLNGTVFGEFRCPMYGFPYEAKYCCGEYGKQYCCIRERSSRFLRGASRFGWLILIVIIIVIVVLLLIRRRRQQQKGVVIIPSEPPMYQQYGPPPFHPPPPQSGNPYGVPPQNPPGNYNPYGQQPYMPYPTQQQQPFYP